MSQTIACPECDKTLQVPDELIGKLVQCPRCRHTFIATGADNAIESPKTAQPGPTRVEHDDDLEDDKPRRRPRSRVDEEDDDAVPSIRKRKPGHVTTLGIMALVGGVVGVSMFLLLVGGSSLACCLWPGTYYSLGAGILAIIRGAALLGERAYEQPMPKAIAILLIINIINGDVINLVLGIIMLVFCEEGDVIEYFRRPANDQPRPHNPRARYLGSRSMSQLITCPECKKHLQVPDDLIGKPVQCPECKHTFTAEASTPTEIVSSTSSAASKRKSTASSAGAKKKAEWDKDNEEEDDDDRRSKSKPPSKRRRNNDDDDDEDDDDDDDRPRRRRSRRSRYGGGGYIAHRGGMILTFGILSLVSFAIFGPLALIFGPIAWIMGNSDIAEIRAGRMDPSGEGMVQTGRILGMIATIICIVGVILFAGFFCCVIGAAGIQKPR